MYIKYPPKTEVTVKFEYCFKFANDCWLDGVSLFLYITHGIGVQVQLNEPFESTEDMCILSGDFSVFFVLLTKSILF